MSRFISISLAVQFVVRGQKNRKLKNFENKGKFFFEKMLILFAIKFCVSLIIFQKKKQFSKEKTVFRINKFEIGPFS
jgi:hypothetical protein